MSIPSVRSVGRAALQLAGRQYRSHVLRRTVFIAVTGSCGKTTTKELIAAVLSARYRGFKTPANCNTPWHTVRSVLRTRPWDDFSVLEVGAAHHAIIPLEPTLSVIQPGISVVTTVGMDHFSVFRSLDAVAAHKGKIVEALPGTGTAVLNADDERVLAMRHRCAGRVVTFGLAADATVSGRDVSCQWPDRLSMVATCEGKSVRVHTQLCGDHLAPNVLAALAVGHVMGIPLDAAADAIARTPPISGRMSPVVTPEGITFIRDDEKAPLWTVAGSLEFMRVARARRKVVVLGTLSDFPGNPSRKYARVATDALSFADAVVGVGGLSSFYLRGKPRDRSQILRAYPNAGEALEFLRHFLEPEDLVLIKGSAVADRLELITREWSPRPASTPTATVEPGPSPVPGLMGGHLIVGIGNPEPKYVNTPHNIGHRIVDVVASQLGLAWKSDAGASVAEGRWQGQHVWLVKLGTHVNDTGPRLRDMAERLGLGPEQCIALFDDLDLALGVVRRRENGSAGGHNGMASIIRAFQSEGVRRVKVGVGRPANGDASAHVLTPFDPVQTEVVARACETAAAQVLEMLARAPQGRSQVDS